MVGDDKKNPMPSPSGLFLHFEERYNNIRRQTSYKEKFAAFLVCFCVRGWRWLVMRPSKITYWLVIWLLSIA